MRSTLGVTCAVLLSTLLGEVHSAPVSVIQRDLDLGLTMSLDLAPTLSIPTLLPLPTQLPTLLPTLLPSLSLPPLSLPSLALPTLSLPGEEQVASLVHGLLPSPTTTTAAEPVPTIEVKSVMTDLLEAAVHALPADVLSLLSSPASALSGIVPASGPTTPLSGGEQPVASQEITDQGIRQSAGFVPSPASPAGTGASDPARNAPVSAPPSTTSSVVTNEASPSASTTDGAPVATQAAGGLDVLGLHLPQINIPGVAGDQTTGVCVKDDHGNYVGWCREQGDNGLLPQVHDTEGVAVHL